MKRSTFWTSVLTGLWAALICAVYSVAMKTNSAQGAEKGLAPWAGGSMPPIGSSFGYRGNSGGYLQHQYTDYANERSDGTYEIYRVSPPVFYYHQHYQPPITTYDRPRTTSKPQYYVPPHSDWQPVPQRSTTTRYVWTLRCGCLGGSYWVLERKVFSW